MKREELEKNEEKNKGCDARKIDLLLRFFGEK
jgi:hypothetical protein